MEVPTDSVLELGHVSEFRFVYWDTGLEYEYYTVKRGHGRCRGGWAVQNGGFTSWDGVRWDENLRGLDAFRYGLSEALAVADQLAREMNLVMIHQMEKKFPGQFRGGPFDMAAQEKA